MNEETQPIVTVYSCGKRLLAKKSTKKAGSYFGGPGYDLALDLPRHGPRGIHHIVTLKHGPFNMIGKGMQTSFYYGLCYENCEMEWVRTAPAAVKFTKINPRKSSKNWPYAAYPDLLPYFPLQIFDESEVDLAVMKTQLDYTGFNISANKIYVIVHSHPELGIALFNPIADVDIVFEYDPDTEIITACNRCT